MKIIKADVKFNHFEVKMTIKFQTELSDMCL